MTYSFDSIIQLLTHPGMILTWDQALFSFRFENYIPAGRAKRKENFSGSR